MNNSFYYLRRVSDNGLQQASLCSPESPGLPLWEVGKLILMVIMSWMCGQPRIRNH